MKKPVLISLRVQALWLLVLLALACVILPAPSSLVATAGHTTPLPTASATNTAPPPAPVLTVNPTAQLSRVSGSWYCRARADGNADIIAAVADGQMVEVMSQFGDWRLVRGWSGLQSCWVYKDAIK